MADIIITVDDKILFGVSQYAAEHNSSVNALVHDYLSSLASQENRASRARARLRELSDQSKGHLGPKAWSRDDLHDR